MAQDTLFDYGWTRVRSPKEREVMADINTVISTHETTTSSTTSSSSTTTSSSSTTTTTTTA